MSHMQDTRPHGVRILWCEVLVACFLIGLFFFSVAIPFCLFCLCALLLHYCFGQFYSDKLLAGLVTGIWLIPTLLWGVWIDEHLSTLYVSILMFLVVIPSSFWVNLKLLEWPPVDTWFSS